MVGLAGTVGEGVGVRQRRIWWLVLATAAAIIYAVMWLGYRLRWSWLDAADAAALNPLHAYGVQHPGWVRLRESFVPSLVLLGSGWPVRW